MFSFQLTAYLDLFAQTIAQCLVEESVVANQKLVVNNDTYFDDDDLDEYLSIGASNCALMGMCVVKFLEKMLCFTYTGMRRRMGVYRFCYDGALFDKEGAVTAIASLAPYMVTYSHASIQTTKPSTTIASSLTSTRTSLFKFVPHIAFIDNHDL